MTNADIIEGLRFPGTAVPRALMQEVVQRREEFVPLLIEEIEKATHLGNAVDLDDFLPFLALYLLAEMRETRARQAIFEFFALDEKTEEDLFDGMISDSGSRILAGVAYDCPEELRAYAQRADISRWVRWAALDALVLLAQWDEQQRESVVGFFAELIEKNQFGDDYESWTSLVNASMDLHPRELLPGIEGLFKRGLVDTSVVGDYAAVQQEAASDPETHHLEFAEHHRPITSTGDEVAHWGAFAEESPETAWSPVSPDPMPSRPEPSTKQIAPRPAAIPAVAGPGIGRNEQCPCGSGKKYKKCCMSA